MLVVIVPVASATDWSAIVFQSIVSQFLLSALVSLLCIRIRMTADPAGALESALLSTESEGGPSGLVPLLSIEKVASARVPPSQSTKLSSAPAWAGSCRIRQQT